MTVLALMIQHIEEIEFINFFNDNAIIDCCVNCGSKFDIVTISSYKGGYICRKCLGNEVLVDIKTIKLLVFRWPLLFKPFYIKLLSAKTPYKAAK